MSASDNPFSRRHQQPLLLFAEVAYRFVDEEAREGVRFADGVPLDGETEPPRGHQGVMVVVRRRNQGAIAPHTST